MEIRALGLKLNGFYKPLGFGANVPGMEVHVTVLLICSRCGSRRELTREARDFGGHVWASRRAVVAACDCPDARPSLVTGFAVVEDVER